MLYKEEVNILFLHEDYESQTDLPQKVVLQQIYLVSSRGSHLSLRCYWLPWLSATGFY